MINDKLELIFNTIKEIEDDEIKRILTISLGTGIKVIQKSKDNLKDGKVDVLQLYSDLIGMNIGEVFNQYNQENHSCDNVTTLDKTQVDEKSVNFLLSDKKETDEPKSNAEIEADIKDKLNFLDSFLNDTIEKK